MNRTGLVIALGLSLVIGLLFGIFPELDLKLAALFYDSTSASFPLKQSGPAAVARDGAMWIAWALALPALIALVGKLVRPVRPMLIPGRAAVFLLVTVLLSAVVLTNLTFKSYWGRPRPVVVTEFNGPWQFSIEEASTPSFGSEEVLIRADAVGICGSDVHGFTGESGRRKAGMVMGHEVAGTVVKTGAEVASLQPGDRVAVYPTLGCGICRHCRAE